MERADIHLGTLVEITLKEGAEWYNGWTQAPTVNPQGYKSPEEGILTGKPGLQGAGYVGKLENDRVTLAPVWEIGRHPEHGDQRGPHYEAGSYFVHGDVIYSFRRLRLG